MQNTTRFTLFILIAFGSVIYSCSSPAPSGEQVYAKNCAGCHGGQLQGAMATALIKKEWNYGRDKNSLIKTISNGIPSTEMMKWKGVIPDNEIEAVADFIIAAQDPSKKIEKAPRPMEVNTKLYKLKIQELVAEGMNDPWGMEFIDSNRMLITGKTGEMYWMVDGKLDTQKITGLPKTYATDMVGGMMDLAIDPQYAKNGWVYVGFSWNPKNLSDKKTPGMTKIVRGKINGHQWTNEQTLFQVNDSLLVKGGTRWGCRFMFDKDGFLYFTIGDMNKEDDSQIPSRPSGKVYRINSDGSIPKDNPYYGQKNYLQAIYSIGNRNVQGLSQDPVTGQIFGSEHGPRGGDELNILKKGANYGWPVITYGIDYDSTIISNDTAKQGMEQPVTYWTPSIAVSAIEFVQSPMFPKWKNDLIVTALKFEEVRRLVIKNNRVMEQELLLKGYGRVRDIKFGPDGAMYVLTNAPDKVLRVVPVEN